MKDNTGFSDVGIDNVDNNWLITLQDWLTDNRRSVLKQLANGQEKISTISQRLGKSRSNVYRTVQDLKEENLVSKQKDTKSYFLTKLGKKLALSIFDFVDNKSVEGRSVDNKNDKTGGLLGRVGNNEDGEGGGGVLCDYVGGHNLRAKFPIEECPDGWEESFKEFFEAEAVEYSELGLKNWSGFQFTLDDFLVKATSKNLVLITRNRIKSSGVGELLREYIPLVFDLKRKVSRWFDELVIGDVPKLIVGEIARNDDVVARLKEDEGFTVVRHSDGRSRVLVDFSDGVELEFVHPGMMDEDSDSWEEQILLMLDSPYGFDQVAVMAEEADFLSGENERSIEGLRGVVGDLVDSQVRNQRVQDMLAENIVSHMSLLEETKGVMRALKGRLEGVDNNVINGDNNGGEKGAEEVGVEYPLLGALKKKVGCLDDVLKYSDSVGLLSERGKERFSMWLFERFGRG